MRVSWHPPGRSPYESDCPDVEQLLFLLRMVQTVQVQGEEYALRKTGLVLDGNDLSLSVWLDEIALAE